MDGYRPSSTIPQPPRASWVMGRSARWHSAEGRALLAEDSLDEEVKPLATYLSARSLLDPINLVYALRLTVRLVRLLRHHATRQ